MFKLTSFIQPNSHCHIAAIGGLSQAWADETLALLRASEAGHRTTTCITCAIGNEPLKCIYGYDGQLPDSRLCRLIMIFETDSGDAILLFLIEENVNHQTLLYNKITEPN